MTFSYFGLPNYSMGSWVVFLVIWEWKFHANLVLGCAETAINTMVFMSFHFFSYLRIWVSSGRILDSILVAFWCLGVTFSDF